MELNLDIFKIESNNVAPKKGRILLAEPFLPGNYFSRSIIFLVAHSDKGAVGFILNKKVDFPIQEVVPDFPEFEGEVHIGGPVATDSIYFIHKLGDKIPGSIQVTENLFWGGNFDVLKKIIGMGMVSPSDVRFFLGYSGWDSGQLEDEIKENSWLVNDVEEANIMNTFSPKSWADYVKKVGKRYSIWENFPENPSLN